MGEKLGTAGAEYAKSLMGKFFLMQVILLLNVFGEILAAHIPIKSCGMRSGLPKSGIGVNGPTCAVTMSHEILAKAAGMSSTYAANSSRGRSCAVESSRPACSHTMPEWRSTLPQSYLSHTTATFLRHAVSSVSGTPSMRQCATLQSSVKASTSSSGSATAANVFASSLSLCSFVNQPIFGVARKPRWLRPSRKRERNMVSKTGDTSDIALDDTSSCTLRLLSSASSKTTSPAGSILITVGTSVAWSSSTSVDAVGAGLGAGRFTVAIKQLGSRRQIFESRKGNRD